MRNKKRKFKELSDFLTLVNQRVLLLAAAKNLSKKGTVDIGEYFKEKEFILEVERYITSVLDSYPAYVGVLKEEAFQIKENVSNKYLAKLVIKYYGPQIKEKDIEKDIRKAYKNIQ